MTKCIMCRAGLHASCVEISCGCNHQSLQIDNDPSPTSLESISIPNAEDERGSVSHNKSNTRRLKRDAALVDQQSTGRKRAARWYPLDREAPCEWQAQTNCGGGLGILGCYAGLQQARHHGPDKSVSNNEQGNVHRICHACHNRWHATNDPTYDWNITTVKRHNPVPQTTEEQAMALVEHLALQSTKQKRIKD